MENKIEDKLTIDTLLTQFIYSDPDTFDKFLHIYWSRIYIIMFEFTIFGIVKDASELESYSAYNLKLNPDVKIQN